MKERTYADKGSHKLRSDYWKALRKGNNDYLPDKIRPPVNVDLVEKVDGVELKIGENFIDVVRR
jgi:hypothetical protein